MLYRVFNNETEVAEANGLWLMARYQAGVTDNKNNKAVDPQITSAWSYGKTMKNGKIACTVPDNWADKFGGIEQELTDDDFEIVSEVV